MKRFYKTVDIAPAENAGGWEITLDTRRVRSPAKAPLVLPTRALATAIAEEWQAQEEELRPHAMPLMRLASTAIDIVAQRRQQVVAEIAKYAETDLVCYRAEHPAELVHRQQEAWAPLVDWAMLRFDAPLAVTSGVIPLPQSQTTLRSYAAAVDGYDTLRLTALQAATAAAGSVVIGLALVEGRLSADEAFAASQIDETWEIEQWGEDQEAMERREALRADLAAASRFVALLGQSDSA